MRISSTINGACLVLLLATVIGVIYRHIWLESGDPHRCLALLSDGQWLDPPGSSTNGPPYQNWQPQACLMQKYKAEDIQQCVGKRKILFIGDSDMRQMFWATARKLDRVRANKEMISAEKHSDLVFVGFEDVTVQFFWDPYLNSTSLYRELTIATLKIPMGMEASIVLIGGGLWFAKNLGDISLQRFSEAIDAIFHVLGLDVGNYKQLNSVLQTLPQRDHATSLVMLAAVPTPLYTSLDSAHAPKLMPAQVNRLNDKLYQISKKGMLPLFLPQLRMTSNQPRTYQPDGLHIVESVADAMADVLLNVKCNYHLTLNGQYPMDKTCCSVYPSANRTQIGLIVVTWFIWLVTWLLPWFLVAPFGDRAKKPQRPSGQDDWISVGDVLPFAILPPRKILEAASILLLVVYYCWSADRTSLWNKAQKQFTEKDFIALCLLTLVLGLVSLLRSRPPRQEKSPRKADDPDYVFLSRDQTDEWKGWMQFIILIYHYTGASQVLWIYKIIRLLVAAYLFMTGYGNAVFFYKKQDYSLKRVAAVLIRLNILSCILPYIMKTHYLFYYFAPLVSFWYLIIYTTMAIGKTWNKVLLLLVTKILSSAAIMTVVIFFCPGFFESIFFFLAKCCNIHWNASEWRFRLALDNYIVYVGMLVGIYNATNEGEQTISYTRSQEYLTADTPKPAGLWQENSLSNRFSYIFRHKMYLYLSLTIVSCLLYARSAYQATNKEVHNESFSMVSMGPVLAFVAVRNSFPWTRRFYSGIFVWMGRHSLETFILQFHIWLAADTKGILSTGFFDRFGWVGRWADFAFLTVLFLWVCWHAAHAIEVLTNYIIDPKSAREDDRRLQHLPKTTSSKALDEKTRNGINATRSVVLGYTAEWLTGIIPQLKKGVAEHLWVRLLLILLVLWGLNWVDQ